MEIPSGFFLPLVCSQCLLFKIIGIKKTLQGFRKRRLERKLGQNQEWFSIKEYTEKCNSAPTAASLDIQVGKQLSQSSWWLWGTARVGLSWSWVLQAESRRSPLQWSWEAYDQGCPFPRNTYCHKILFVCPLFVNIPSLESFVKSGWSAGIEPVAARSYWRRNGRADAFFFCSRTYL